MNISTLVIIQNALENRKYKARRLYEEKRDLLEEAKYDGEDKVRIRCLKEDMDFAWEEYMKESNALDDFNSTDWRG